MTTSPTGTGVGVNLAAVPASNTDLMANAQTENAKKALALIADSLKSADVSFVEHRSYKYDNHTNRPALSHPMQQVRVPVDTYGPSSEAWQQKYEELVNQLPAEVKAWLQEQMGLSFYLRDLEFFAFHAVLVTTADGLSILEKALLPQSPALLERAQENLAMPFMAIQAAIVQGREIVQQGLSIWQEIGRNDPNFDKNINYLDQTADLLKELEEVIGDLAKDPPPKTAAQQLNQLSKSAELLKTTYNATSAGNELQLLKNVIDNLSLATSLLQLGYGPASLLLMLTVNAKETPLTKLIDQMITGFNNGEKNLLGGAMNVLFTLTLATTLGVAERGLNNLPHLDKDSDKTLRSMTLALAAPLLVHTNLLQNAYRNLAATLTADQKTKELIENGATLANFTLLLASLDDKLSTTLFQNLNKNLLTLVDKVGAQLEALTEPALAPVKIYLQQAKIALENSNYPGFKEAYQGLVESFNLSPNQLTQAFEEINRLGTLIKESINKGLTEATNRHTVIQAA